MQKPNGVDRRRFIPACAGNSAQALIPIRSRPVHPRVCGELRWPNARRRSGLTVHPRVCGELAVGESAMSCRYGSSPRVRGTPPERFRGVRFQRFIPACAGNSAPAARTRRRRPVHPRVCGELASERANTVAGSGSSPRVRGTQLLTRLFWPSSRFIPACAGNSSPPRRRSPAAPVHPRVCGELTMRRMATQHLAGSSPRVRGTQSPRRSLTRRVRFIPACAGNSLTNRDGWDWTTVHPRVCGELGFAVHGTSKRHGSSPRVRGTPRCSGPS